MSGSAAAEDHIGVIVLKRQLLCVSHDKAGSVLQSSLANPLFKEWLHVRIDVQPDHREVRPLGQFHVEIARTATDVDTNPFANSSEFPKHPHGRQRVSALDSMFHHPVECFGVRLS